MLYVNFLVLTIIFLVHILYVSTATAEEIKVEDDKERIFESTKYESDELIVNIDDGYHLYVEVLSLKTVYSKADFLIIKSGAQIEDEGTGIIFAQRLKTPEKFVIVSTKVLMKFVVGSSEAANEEGGFKILYKRIGEKNDKTTSSPITTNTWPTAPPEERTSIEVYVKGRQLLENKTAVLDFKVGVAKMAILYCDMNNIAYNPNKNITEDNVKIQKLVRCSYNWPDSENCVKIIFSVPIILMQPKISDYELSSGHLEVMWERYSTDYLKSIDLDNYNSPDPDGANTSWQMIFGLTLFLFITIIIAIVGYKDRSRLCGEKKRDGAQQMLPTEDNQEEESRNSVVSITNPFSENILDYIEGDSRPYHRSNHSFSRFVNDNDDDNEVHFDKADTLRLSGIENLGMEHEA